MKKILLLLAAAQLLLSGVWEAANPPPQPPPSPPAVTAAPAPERPDGLYELLERLSAQYDPAAAGSVGAVLWAEKLMDAYVASGADPAAAAAAAAALVREHPDADLAAALPRLRAAAERLASGGEMGLIRDGAHRGGGPWTPETAEELFTALAKGLAAKNE